MTVSTKEESKEENLAAHSSLLAEVDLENLMNLYGSSVLKFAYAYFKDKSTAEDIFQEVS
ncbi:hypothetical protein [Desulfitobacterium hafniense]|uniref:hypothetical protein n=1 Tax=Desulfitobacterium hafniense TaxID=49338 RepID=UPI0003687868|nr:hypothetical protein [Desulfitobacterium hafniense]